MVLYSIPSEQEFTLSDALSRRAEIAEAKAEVCIEGRLCGYFDTSISTIRSAYTKMYL